MVIKDLVLAAGTALSFGIVYLWNEAAGRADVAEAGKAAAELAAKETARTITEDSAVVVAKQLALIKEVAETAAKEAARIVTDEAASRVVERIKDMQKSTIHEAAKISAEEVINSGKVKAVLIASGVSFVAGFSVAVWFRRKDEDI